MPEDPRHIYANTGDGTQATPLVVAYLRVSTERQADEGLGLEVQEWAIRKWAQESGHRIAGVFADEGVSGAKDLEDRPGLIDALAALREGPAGGLVVYRLDRLARDLIVQEQLLAEVGRLGARVHSTSAGEAGYLADDPDDPSRRMIRQVLGAVAEYERSMIVLRLRSGRRRKADHGGYAFGAPPFGQRAEAKALVADGEEAAAVDRMVELRAAGVGLREISRRLLMEGHKPRRADVWHPTVISRILERRRQAAA